jgi:hypothetical protein
LTIGFFVTFLFLKYVKVYYYYPVNLDLTRRRSVFHPSIVVNQGYLFKKRWNECKHFKNMTFKKRYFWIKYDSVSYAKKPTDQVCELMYKINVSYSEDKL